MKGRMKTYLDTSVISALFDEKNPERKSLTETFFEKAEEFEIYVSQVTIEEIERAPDLRLQRKMREITSGFSILSLTDDVEWLAREYIRHDAVPKGYPEDAYHIAIAVINGMDCLLSWNFKHIIRKRTKDIVRMVNTLNGMRQIEMMTPAELL